MTRAARTALEESGLDADAIDLVVGCGRGLPGPDRAEAEGISAAFDDRSTPCPATNPSGALGAAEAASGLLAVASALSAMKRSQAHPMMRRPNMSPEHLQWVGPGARGGDYARVLIAGASDAGNSAVVVLERVGDCS
jgi:3-oxoacyl-(acyl-carrier-protein) synthase